MAQPASKPAPASNAAPTNQILRQDESRSFEIFIVVHHVLPARVMSTCFHSGARPSPEAASSECSEETLYSEAHPRSCVAAPEDGRAPGLAPCSNFPRAAHGLVDVTVGFLVVDESLFLWIEMQQASGLPGGLGQVNEGAGTMAVLLV